MRPIEEEEYCIDIRNQLNAVQKALALSWGKYIGNPYRNCVAQALASPGEAQQKIAELTKIIKR